MATTINDFTRTFLFSYPGDRTAFSLSFEDDFYVALRKKAGRDPLFDEVLYAVHQFLLEYEEEFGEPVPVCYERQNRYRFARRTGSTGCQTVFLEEDWGDGFPVRHRVIHISMYGKIPDFRCYSQDFFDHLVGEGNLLLENGEGGGRHYVPTKDLEIAGEVSVFKPRLLAYEEGWVSPWENPPATVPLVAVRERPEEDESPRRHRS